MGEAAQHTGKTRWGAMNTLDALAHTAGAEPLALGSITVRLLWPSVRVDVVPHLLT